MASNTSHVEVAPSPNEPLSCTQCRGRKLKCDRIKPSCTRCSKIKGECVYPESRRKPAFKRRNVKELEERLAQVEVLLKESAGGSKPAEEQADETIEFDLTGVPPPTEDVYFGGLDYSADLSSTIDGPQVFPPSQASPYAFVFESTTGPSTSSAPFTGGGELIDLGISEPLPPFEVMEELNKSYFTRQQHFIPILHPTRYLQSFYSAHHMKPPMCLQYALWALAANGHEKYNSSHEIFYHRARQYAEADEMRAYGEHFITVAHAQAWCIIATYEAKCMLYTRAAMSSARSVRLVQMMGLQRLDSPPKEVAPTLVPPKDWCELEERRRTFWGTFCIDSYCSVSTGWPFLIDGSEITTHLPSSEAAFASGEAAESCSLDDAFEASSYSSFAGAILVCHIFNQIIKHVHRPKTNDSPQDYEYGEFWKRHRKIDNSLSSAFMFLPEPFRLPENYRDPTAVHVNLNFHASIICLHHAAIEKIDEHGLSLDAKKASHNRLLTAAQEIVNIAKMTSHLNSHPKSPMGALSLYCAATVYIYQCKETQSSKDIDNLDFIIAAMDAIGRGHMVTRAFLKQVMIDIDRNGITDIIRLPRLKNLPHVAAIWNHNIPLLARSQVSKHSQVQPPLPGRLPLGRPQGYIAQNKMGHCDIAIGYPMKDTERWLDPDVEEGGPNKRKRTASAATSDPGLGATPMGNECPFASGTDVSRNPSQETSAASMSSGQSQNSGQNPTQPPFISETPRNPGLAFASMMRNLPHRTDSTIAGSGPSAPVQGSPRNMSDGQDATPSFGQSGLRTSDLNIGFIEPPTWDSAGICMHSQFQNRANVETISETDPWGLAGTEDNVDWASIVAAAGIDTSTRSGDGNGGERANSN